MHRALVTLYTEPRQALASDQEFVPEHDIKTCLSKTIGRLRKLCTALGTQMSSGHLRQLGLAQSVTAYLLEHNFAVLAHQRWLVELAQCCFT